ncbi:MAG TPA: YdcF family protein [Gemmatimonadaceae bacterium]|nr:YdcF family protein [Gemmatimonadaceae bacterium]
MKQRRHLLQRIAMLVALVLLAGWAAAAASVVVWGARDEARPASAIVVLGAAQYAGRPSPVFKARLDHGIELWQGGMAPYLILTGGTGIGDTTSEAAVGRRYAIRMGVPDSAIRLDSVGRTTSESLREVSQLMDALPDRSVVLVSDPFHSLRASILARRLGLKPYSSPTRTSPIAESRDAWKYIVSESVKVPLALIFQRRST